jgi:tripartite-type tricarboxylate transporter receptor subunit TctC
VLNDLAPVSTLASIPLVLLARKMMPAEDLKELIAWLKGNPNKASAGVVTASERLETLMFQKETGTRFALVPYRGNALAAQDLAAGQIDLFFDTPVQLPLVRAGSIKAYAVTSDARMAVAPDIPTFAELGLPVLSFSAWYELFAPKGTPKDIIDKLNGAAVEALADAAVRSRFIELGLNIYPRERQTPGALAALVKADAEKWWPIIKEFGMSTRKFKRSVRLLGDGRPVAHRIGSVEIGVSRRLRH